MINTEHAKTRTGSNKLRTYKLFKQKFGFESYLNIANPDLRKATARLRLSAHRLRIEAGRYNSKNKYVPPSERICPNCDSDDMEDEMHFVLECPKYIMIRTRLFNNISACNKHFMNYNKEQKFVWLFINDDLNCQKALASFIMESMALRL